MKGSTPIQSVSINGWALRYQLLHSVEAETGKNSFDASIVKGKPIEIHQELDKRSHMPLKTWSAVFRISRATLSPFSAYEVDQVVRFSRYPTTVVLLELILERAEQKRSKQVGKRRSSLSSAIHCREPWGCYRKPKSYYALTG